MLKIQKDWIPGKIINLSTHGALVNTYDPPQPNTIVNLEIMDIGDKPLKCIARATWRQGWEDSIQLPRAGFSFETASFDSYSKRTLNDFLFHSYKKMLAAAFNK